MLHVHKLGHFQLLNYVWKIVVEFGWLPIAKGRGEKASLRINSIILTGIDQQAHTNLFKKLSSQLNGVSVHSAFSDIPLTTCMKSSLEITQLLFYLS